MKKPVAKSLALAVIGVAALVSGPVRADVGANDVKGTSIQENTLVDRTIPVDQGTRWVNVNQGETVQFAVMGQGGTREFVWRFDGLGDQLDLSDIDREAALSIPIYVNQTMNPLHAIGGDSE